MHPADIHAALLKAGHTQSMVADQLGVSRALISSVIWGKSRSSRVENHIATLLKRPLAQVFPHRLTRRQQLVQQAA